jgi:pimeloyl-ACP methyl ester carboxylesterase
MTDQRIVVSRRQLLLSVMGAAGGCALQGRTPPLAELYRGTEPNEPQPPLIVIPGAFGSRLRRRSTGEEIWPGSNMKILFSSFRKIELAIDPRTLEPVTGDFMATGLFLEAFGLDFYGTLLETLETAGGYQPGSLVTPSSPAIPTYYIYAYDWRLDTVAGVRGLHELIERIRDLYGDSRLKVDIVAHSNGGTMARYYARFGTTDVLSRNAAEPSFNGSDRIRRLLLVGTPNLGTIQAVLSQVRGEEVGFRHVPVEVVATCPAVAQLMPHPHENLLLNVRGDPVELDLYDIDTWRQLRWSIFSTEARRRVFRGSENRRAAEAHLETLEAFVARQLELSRRFHELLSAPSRPDEPKPYLFGGDCSPTLARLIIEEDGDTYRAYERADRVPRSAPKIDFSALINEPGDGVVTRSSLTRRPRSGELPGIEPLEISHSVFLCESHKRLTANLSFQDNLLYTLLNLEED